MSRRPAREPEKGHPPAPAGTDTDKHRSLRETQDSDQHRGVPQAAVDAFLDRTRAVSELMTTVGSEALGRVPEPIPSSVNRMLGAMRLLAEQAPPITAELRVLIEEVHAKRKSIQALQAELAALDHQLEVLERALGPVEAWAKNWERLQHALTESLDLPQG